MLIDSRTRDAGEEELRARIAEPDFPCVGAKSALARGTLKTLVCHSLASGWDDLRIHRELMDWADGYKADPTGLRSLAVVFAQPLDLDEPTFERLMWERIQSLADKDHWLGQPYDERMREKIIARDIELAGTINPMLARHGEASEARQYSGRVVEEGWRCPFRDKRASKAA